LPRLLRAPADFFAGFFADFVLLFAFDLAPRDAPVFDFPRFADLPFAELRREALAFKLLPPFFIVRLAPPADLLLFLGTLGLIFLAAFLAFVVTELLEAARPASAPTTPPTTAPTGPATLPRTAPAAAPAASFEMGGIWMFSDDEPDVSVDDGFSSGITSALLQGVKLCSLLFTTYFGWRRLFSCGQRDFISGSDAARSVESEQDVLSFDRRAAIEKEFA